jgi:predicted transcriptional regulator
MSVTAKNLLDRVASWPAEDIQELDDYARVIEARRTGVYVMSDDERAAVMRGLEQARRGEFVSDEEVEAFWKRCGVK